MDQSINGAVRLMRKFFKIPVGVGPVYFEFIRGENVVLLTAIGFVLICQRLLLQNIIVRLQ